MIDSLKSKQYTGQVAPLSNEARGVIANGLLAVILNLAVTAGGIFLGSVLPSVQSFFTGIFGLIAFMVMSIALIVFIQSKHDSVLGFIGFMAFGLLEGLFLSSYVLMFPMSMVMTALGGTVLIAFVCMLIATKTDVDSSNWGKYLIGALIIAISAIVVNIFVGSTMLSAAVSVAVILIMGGMLIYETQEAMKRPQDGYLLFALGFYLSVINIFIHLLNLLGILDD